MVVLVKCPTTVSPVAREAVVHMNKVREQFKKNILMNIDINRSVLHTFNILTTIPPTPTG